MPDVTSPFDELLEYYAQLPSSFSVLSKVRLLEAYGALRLAKANEKLAESIAKIATTPIAVETKTSVVGVVNVETKAK